MYGSLYEAANENIRQCTYTFLRGVQCVKKAVPGTRYCSFHPNGRPINTEWV